MKIEVIYIPCYKSDYRLCRICVASIRYWYPDIPIVIVKDLLIGDFDTTELEQAFNVSVFPQVAKAYGWGFSKFEVFFQKEKRRFLMLDSDIVFIGPMLDILEQYNTDWIVFDEPFSQVDLLKYYFDPDKIKELDPDFNFPGYHFNTGQFVGWTGILKRSDFDQFIEWKEPRIQLHREAFTFGGEQPLLNYVLMKKEASKEMTVHKLDFMREGLHPETQSFLLDRIKKKEGYPYIIHWHDGKVGIHHPKFNGMPRADILLFFENLYNRNAGVSHIVQSYRIWKKFIKNQLYWKYKTHFK